MAALQPTEPPLQRYVKVVNALGSMGFRGSAPEALLPVPKAELLAILDLPVPGLQRDKLIAALENFQSGGRAMEMFCVRLMFRPAVLALGYSLAATWFGDASWWWPVAALAGTIGAWIEGPAQLLAIPQKYDGLSRPKQLLLVWGAVLAEAIWIIAWGLIWARMVIYSGLQGLYGAAFVQFTLTGIATSCLALFVGWHFSRQLNALFFFVVRAQVRRAN